MNVTCYFRRPGPASHSIERVFRAMIQALPDNVRPRLAVSRFLSQGFWPRLYNMIEAVGRQGDVNHITGDVYYLALFLRKKKTVLTIHDCVRLNYLWGWKKWILWLFWYWLPVHRCARITTTSESTRRELLGFVTVPPSKIVVIHDPLPQGYVPNPKPFTKNRPVFLQVGTNAQKNIERVAEALSGLACRLRIIGILSQSQLAALRDHQIDYASASSLNDAQMIGEYRRCDAVIFASTYEGFGMPIIEGQAVGRPVITSSVCSMPEVAGDAACLVDPFDSASIRRGVVKVIDDDHYRAQLVARGYVNARRFNPEAIAGQYVGLYREIANR